MFSLVLLPANTVSIVMRECQHTGRTELNELLSDVTTEIVIAASMWALSLFFPFRRLNAPREYRLDTIAVLLAAIFGVIAAFALATGFDLLQPALNGLRANIAAWPPFAVVIGFVLTADCTSYWAHRLLHTKALWHTHAFHHSSQHLYVLSGLRGSFVHVLALFSGPLFALYLFPVYQWPGALAVITVSQVANQHYTHSNIRLPWSNIIELLFVTPRYHFVHHSVDRRLSNTNFGFLLTVWDRLFGTYSDPSQVAVDEPLGLDYENSRWRLAVGLPPGPKRLS